MGRIVGRVAEEQRAGEFQASQDKARTGRDQIRFRSDLSNVREGGVRNSKGSAFEIHGDEVRASASRQTPKVSAAGSGADRVDPLSLLEALGCKIRQQARKSLVLTERE